MQNLNLELEKVVREIRSTNAKKVVLQLPDGLKPIAAQLADTIESETDAEVFVWSESNFGACDIPKEVEHLNFDLIINFGHSNWKSRKPKSKKK